MKKLVTFAAVASLTIASNVMAQEGEAVYQKACKTCHDMGIAGAPKLKDAEAWAPRMGKGLDALVASVKTGLNAMPPGGMCMDCTDEDLKKAIEYMAK
ncbi:c-type cytochrome [Ferrimonas pelagia]|uniref:Monoheme cytochrome c5 ScyA n=1 Tax=Ferrimonas pelagia TaxID=1177826 RepID=A0ABP9F0H1_9GAMM